MNNDYDLDQAIRKVPDFPKPGILFYDITGVLINPEAFRYCIDKMVDLFGKNPPDAVAAVEARGFLFAAPFADRLGLPIIIIRKKGKLPGKTLSRKFALEYGEDEIQIHAGDISPGQRVVLVDDLAATGGTLKASVELIRQGGGEVTDIFAVIGLPFLPYEEKLKPLKVHTLIQYNSE